MLSGQGMLKPQCDPVPLQRDRCRDRCIDGYLGWQDTILDNFAPFRAARFYPRAILEIG
jgi:hypothetical protein